MSDDNQSDLASERQKPARAGKRTERSWLAANDNLIDSATEVWRSRSECDLSRENVREIVVNITGFFTTLHAWAKAANDNDTVPVCNPIVKEERDER